MKNLFALSLLLLSLSAPAIAAKKKVGRPHRSARQEAPASGLDRELEEARLSPLNQKAGLTSEDLREDLKLSVNGKELESENFPLAPAENESLSRE